MKQLRIGTIIKFGIPVILFAICFYLAFFLLGMDVVPFLMWWFTLLLLGIVFYPTVGRLFHRFSDGGWLFSKTIGLGFTGWLLWYLSSMRLLKFTAVNARFLLSVCLALNILVLFLQLNRKKTIEGQSKENVYAFSEKKVLNILYSELIFLSVFLFWCYTRGFKPEAYGTEKFMDYGFMTTMMRTEYMPPEDLWLSGNYINYYYVGQYMATYLTKLSGVTVGYGYNLMMMTLAAFGFALPYAIICNVMKTFLIDRKAELNNIKQVEADFFTRVGVALSKTVPYLSGLLAGVAVCFAGNMHYPIYRYIVPWISKIRGLEYESYWFPDATRYIGYHPETNDKTIHEFPLYSFVLGDLHAHVLNIIFVLTLLALLFVFLLDRKQRMDALRQGLANEEIFTRNSVWKEIFHPVILLVGFFIGLFRTTNFWDFPIYFVVSGAVILFSNAVIYRFKKHAIYLTACHALVVLVIAELTALPFTLKFNQISTRVCLAEARTPLYQLLVLWGLPVILVAVYTILCILDLKKSGRFSNNLSKEKKNRNKLYLFIEQLKVSDLFIITIGLCAIGLVFMPEIVYVQDIYSGDYKRANTMFKLTYQAFIMFGCCFGYIIVRLLAFKKTWIRRCIGGLSLLLLISTVFYSRNAINSWYHNIFNKEQYKTLDASAFMEDESLDDYLATNWLNENIDGTCVVLEAQGDSYTYYQRVSVITGLPTVMGWTTHEWLWRSDATGAYPAICSERAEDVKQIYNADSVQAARRLLDKYDVAYVYVGALEREKYTELNEEVMRHLGTVVFESNSTGEPTFIVKIK